MRLRILTEDDSSLISSVATGGFCNVLQGANYAPSFSDRADHVKAPHARLQTPNAGCTDFAWASSPVVAPQTWIAGSTLTSAKLTYAFPPCDVTGTTGVSPGDVLKDTCAPLVTYHFSGLAAALTSVVTIPARIGPYIGAYPTLEVATADKALAGVKSLLVECKYNSGTAFATKLPIQLTIVDPCVAPTTVVAGA